MILFMFTSITLSYNSVTSPDKKLEIGQVLWLIIFGLKILILSINICDERVASF